MHIDYAIILSAGMGTRMGEIGRVLPKVLWPIFEKSLLELHVTWARRLGARKIFINSHHRHCLVEKSVERWDKNDDITLFYEPELLDSGGGIHNILINEKLENGRLLTMNCDTFFFCPNTFWTNMEETLSRDADAVLAALPVSDVSYNKFLYEDGRLKGIGKPADGEKFETFSGIGLFDIEKIRKVPGKSKFFKTVANFDQQKVAVLTPDKFEYYDFGTSEKYYGLMQELLKAIVEGNENSLVEFLVETGAIDTEKVEKNSSSYGAPCENCINLSGESLGEEFRGVIVLRRDNGGDVESGPGILYNSTFQSV